MESIQDEVSRPRYQSPTNQLSIHISTHSKVMEINKVKFHKMYFLITLFYRLPIRNHIT